MARGLAPGTPACSSFYLPSGPLLSGLPPAFHCPPGARSSIPSSSVPSCPSCRPTQPTAGQSFFTSGSFLLSSLHPAGDPPSQLLQDAATDAATAALGARISFTSSLPPSLPAPSAPADPPGQLRAAGQHIGGAPRRHGVHCLRLWHDAERAAEGADGRRLLAPLPRWGLLAGGGAVCWGG